MNYILYSLFVQLVFFKLCFLGAGEFDDFRYDNILAKKTLLIWAATITRPIFAGENSSPAIAL